MFRFKMVLGVTETQDKATFECEGSDAWLKECLPFIGYILGAMVGAHGHEPAEALSLGREFAEAQQAIARGLGYAGQYLTVTLTQ